MASVADIGGLTHPAASGSSVTVGFTGWTGRGALGIGVNGVAINSVTGGDVTWTNIGGGFNYTRIYEADGVPDGTDITIELASAAEALVIGFEIFGDAGAGNHDTAVTASGNGTTATCGDLGTLDASDVAVYLARSVVGGTAHSAQAGSTQLRTITNGTSVRSISVGYSTTDDTPGATVPDNDWDIVGAIFNDAATGTIAGGINRGLVNNGLINGGLMQFASTKLDELAQWKRRKSGLLVPKDSHLIVPVGIQLQGA